jgi:hypothetical protein
VTSAASPAAWSSIRSRSARQAGKLNGRPSEGGRKGRVRESFIHIHVARVEDRTPRRIVQALEQGLAEVRRCVQTGGRCSIIEVIPDLKANPPPVPVDDIAEAIQFSNGSPPTIHLARRARLHARRQGARLSRLRRARRACAAAMCRC